MAQKEEEVDMQFTQVENINELAQSRMTEDNQSLTTDGQPYNQRRVMTAGSTDVVSVGGDLSEEKLVFKLIYRSDQHQADALVQHLNEIKGKIDVTNIFDRTGYSPLNYAAYKDRYMAFKALISHVQQKEKDVE